MLAEASKSWHFIIAALTPTLAGSYLHNFGIHLPDLCSLCNLTQKQKHLSTIVSLQWLKMPQPGVIGKNYS